jgi:hypothetical protein
MAYVPTGLSEEVELAELDLVRAHRADRLAVDRERLRIEKGALKAVNRAAVFEGISMAIVVAVPIAALLGLQRYFKWLEKK